MCGDGLAVSHIRKCQSSHSALTKRQGYTVLLKRLPNASVNVISSQAPGLTHGNLFQQREHTCHWVLPLPVSTCRLCCG
jgi:hypothetical protein